jgi:hypothetical protein
VSSNEEFVELYSRVHVILLILSIIGLSMTIILNICDENNILNNIVAVTDEDE